MTDKYKTKRWNDKDIDFLKNKYKSLKRIELANILNRTERSIIAMMHHLKLRKLKSWGKEKLKEEIIKKSIEIKRVPTAKDMGSLTELCHLHFGSWNNALIYSGFNINQERESTLKKGYEIMNTKKAYLLGAVYGDACVSINNISLKVKDKDFADYFVKCFYDVYGLEMTMKLIQTPDRIKNGKIYKCSPVWYAFITAKKVAEDLKSYGDTKTFSWRIPKEIYDSDNKEIISNFLKGFVDSEGCVYVGKRGCSIQIASSNINGLKQISNLLKKIGINNNLNYNTPNKFISICFYDNQKRFFNLVGLTINRKKEKLLQYFKKRDIDRKVETPIIVSTINLFENQKLQEVVRI